MKDNMLNNHVSDDGLQTANLYRINDLNLITAE
jgi:hypothetical protein